MAEHRHLSPKTTTDRLTQTTDGASRIPNGERHTLGRRSSYASAASQRTRLGCRGVTLPRGPPSTVYSLEELHAVAMGQFLKGDSGGQIIEEVLDTPGNGKDQFASGVVAHDLPGVRNSLR